MCATTYKLGLDYLHVFDKKIGLNEKDPFTYIKTLVYTLLIFDVSH